mgnify:CR=1 FL=1
MANRTNMLITILVAVIVVLAVVMVYAFIVKPRISGYNVEKQTEGVQIAINYIVAQLQQNGFVQIPIGNQTLILVPYTPPQQQIQPQ